MKSVLIPGPSHPITVAPLGRPAKAVVGGTTVASSDHALELREAAYPPVIYFPRRDVEMALLERTTHTTYCPYKGDASYYRIPASARPSANAAWTYETPHDAMTGICEYIAFYPDQVDTIS